ncbi:hypothetical protein [Sphingomonas sp. S2-65]|uniref:hypothetical protein n=1 Tax=Sphingomonas sp. S2-65 TaxID=2903960 RepID=UPI001F1A541F|nr:hypothetical protein [Sphingomonas sp. S2-65]UYY57134.1 hypothetical protein LZ586_10585 [Sphingomonas sp. S2-65]
MKVYVVRRSIEVFDGTGTLSPAAKTSLEAIGGLVCKVLRAGGDGSHVAAIWRGTVLEDAAPAIEAISTPSALALPNEMLDPNRSTSGYVPTAWQQLR